MWFYIPSHVEPEQYALISVGVVRVSSQNNLLNYSAYIPIITVGDTVEVLPPPCSISSQTSIVFDTTGEEGMKVSAPVAFQCDTLSVISNQSAFLQVRPISSLISDTKLEMTTNGSQPGGIVRGYAGNDFDSSQANWLDNTHSHSFNQAFGPLPGTVTSNNHQELPLIWQLCRKGNEVSGLATASEVLVVNYK